MHTMFSICMYTYVVYLTSHIGLCVCLDSCCGEKRDSCGHYILQHATCVYNIPLTYNSHDFVVRTIALIKRY